MKKNYIRNHVGLIWTFVAITTALSLGSARPASAQAVGASWSYTGSLDTARYYHTATLLPNGKVLVAAGVGADYNDCLSSAELYDPATGTWSSTGNLHNGRFLHTATRLPNGKVLVVGGFNNTSSLNSAELYDPATETWSSTGNLDMPRGEHTATLLLNGKVLVAGGYNSDDVFSAELYDPATGTWSSTGNLNTARESPSATLLTNGNVMVAGGYHNEGTLSSAELYNPVTGTWSSTGNLNLRRGIPIATLLLSGKVLIVDVYSKNAELYDPATGTWSRTGNLNRTVPGTATLLPSGKLLVAGYVNDFGSYFPAAESYDPVTETWSMTTDPNEPRAGHTATLLPGGKVLVAGNDIAAIGIQNRTAELYSSGTNPIDDAQFFVRQHYRDFLNREPDPDGLTFWTREITSCGADAQCIEVKRINDSASFFLSIEFQETGYLVYRFYKSAFGNLPSAPVPIKFADFLADDQQLGQGVIVNEAGWQIVLENNKQAYTNAFVQRSQFTSSFPTSISPAMFVDTLFANAGVTPTGTDRTAAIGEFGGAATTADGAARARTLRRVAENSTLAQQEFNRAFVLMQYFGYLRRNPNDAPEPTLDFQGYNFWLNKLDSFNGNFVNAEMVKAFLSSTEYRHRFEP